MIKRTFPKEVPVERHPLQPFLPSGAKVLMLGSFPPKRERWSMPFYYPNFQNDMWRILGFVFFGDKDFFVCASARKFDYERVVKFCTEKGIALYDTATAVRRLKDNASDKFLEIAERTDVPAFLAQMPQCAAVVVTGQKAAETLAETLACDIPAVGSAVLVRVGGREVQFFRMPSSSRAYPLALEKKAEFYRNMFLRVGVL